jgi:hypothetical protein
MDERQEHQRKYNQGYTILNFDEGKQFVRDLLTAFPAFDDAARNSPDLAATHRSWIAAWNDLTYVDCHRALTTLIKDGGINYEDYRSPGPFIRRLVLSNRGTSIRSEAELADREATRYEREQRRKDYKGSPMAQALVAAMKCDSKESACAVIESIITSRHEYDQPRYNCSCCDYGLVQVWRADYVHLVRTGKKNIEELNRSKVYLIACNCVRGEIINEARKVNLPFYSDAAFCLFKDLGIEEDRRRLAAWIKEQSKGVEWVC